jgi:hypothetical protein
MTAKKFSKTEAIKFGWGAVHEDLAFLIILLITAILVISSPRIIQWLAVENSPVLSLSELLGIGARRWWSEGFSLFDAFLFMIREAANFPIASYLFFTAEWALKIIIAMGMLKIWLKYADGIKGEFRDLFSCAPLFFKYLFGSILYNLIVFSGLVLLVIPGLFFFIKFKFYDYFIVDQGLGPIAALQRSYQATAGNEWELFFFMLLLLGINMLGCLACGIGLLVTLPASMIAMAFVYRKLLAPEESAAIG